MVEKELLQTPVTVAVKAPYDDSAKAAGVFGFSIADGETHSFAPIDDYVRNLEQMPNFRSPSPEYFIRHYLSSNMGLTKNAR